jgi:hypothetical protein
MTPNVETTFLGHLSILKTFFCHQKKKVTFRTMVGPLLDPSLHDEQTSLL